MRDPIVEKKSGFQQHLSSDPSTGFQNPSYCDEIIPTAHFTDRSSTFLQTCLAFFTLNTTLHTFASNVINSSTPWLLFLGRQVLPVFRAYCVWKALKCGFDGKWERQGDQQLHSKRHDQASEENLLSLLGCCWLSVMDDNSINSIWSNLCFSICWVVCSTELKAFTVKITAHYISKLTSTNHSIWSKLVAFKHFVKTIRHGCRLYFMKGSERFRGDIPVKGFYLFSARTFSSSLAVRGSIGFFFPQGDWNIWRMVRMTEDCVHLKRSVNSPHECSPRHRAHFEGAFLEICVIQLHSNCTSFNVRVKLPTPGCHKISLVHKRQCSSCGGRGC